MQREMCGRRSLPNVFPVRMRVAHHPSRLKPRIQRADDIEVVIIPDMKQFPAGTPSVAAAA